MNLGTWEYIEQLSKIVKDLEERVNKSHKNIGEIQNTANSWVLQPIFMRKDGRRDALLNLEDKTDRLKML